MKKLLLLFGCLLMLFQMFSCVSLSKWNVRTELSVVFVNDYSGSMGDQAIQSMESAVLNYIDFMRDTDEGQYIAFGKNIIKQTADFADPANLRSAVSGAGVDSAGTALYDAIYMALLELEPVLQERVRSVIVLTDGLENASGRSIEEVIEKAQDLEIPVFTIGLGSSMDREVLKQIADETGGKFLETPSREDLRRAYRLLMRELTGRAYLAN